MNCNDKSDQHYGSSTCLVTLMNFKAWVSQNHFQSLNRRPEKIMVGTCGDEMLRKTMKKGWIRACTRELAWTSIWEWCKNKINKNNLNTGEGNALNIVKTVAFKCLRKPSPTHQSLTMQELAELAAQDGANTSASKSTNQNYKNWHWLSMEYRCSLQTFTRTRLCLKAGVMVSLNILATSITRVPLPHLLP